MPICEKVFDFSSLLSSLVQQASHGCGLSDTVFTTNFCAAVDQQLLSLPQSSHSAFISAAKEHGYIASDALATERQFLKNAGYCRCGLDEMTCPSGCFEGEPYIENPDHIFTE
jgi:hypothetical protein